MATQVSKKLPYVVLKTPSYGIDPTIRVFDKVRKTPFYPRFYTQNDRFTKNTGSGQTQGKLSSQTPRFCRR